MHSSHLLKGDCTIEVRELTRAHGDGVVVTISARSRTYEGTLPAVGLLVPPLIDVRIAQATGPLLLGPCRYRSPGPVAVLSQRIPRGSINNMTNMTARL